MGSLARPPGKQPFNKRRRDPYYDRRSGEDRRKVYSLFYFQMGNEDRRSYLERRANLERRTGYVRVSEWSSICVTPECLDKDKERIEF